MLVSTSKRFIFFHVPKTAGTSVTSVLAPYCHGHKGPMNAAVRRLVGAGLIPNFRVFDLRTYEAHLRFRDAEKLLPTAVLDGFLKFTVVRNPYERFVSFYHFIAERPQNKLHDYAARAGSFSAFIDEMKNVAEPSQKSYLVDSNGRFRMDSVLRFENLNSDFAELCRRLEIDAPLPRENVTKTPRPPWSELYTPREQEIVYEFYREDFEEFGYERDLPLLRK